MASTLEGKVALVTGGGTGIGRATSLAFAREGATVIVSDMNAKTGEETTELVRAAGGSAAFIRADVTRATDVAALIDATIAAHHRLDCAFNNAGIAGPIGLQPSRRPRRDRGLIHGPGPRGTNRGELRIVDRRAPPRALLRNLGQARPAHR